MLLEWYIVPAPFVTILNIKIILFLYVINIDVR